MNIQKHKLLFKTLVGSHSYGTNIEGSDEDYKGIYLQHPEDVYINGYKEQLDISKDECYYELGRFLNLCMTGNSTMLELLWAPKECIVYIDPIFEEILKIKDIFLTKNLRHSFGGYAIEQIKKAGGLDKKMNWENKRLTRKSVEDLCSIYPFPKKRYIGPFSSQGTPLLDYLHLNEYDKESCGLVKIEHFRDCFLLFYKNGEYRGITSSPMANEVILSEVPKYERPLCMLFFHRDAYSTHCKEWNEYEDWLKKRNTQRYVDIEGHGQKIDGKNILHCIRIIETALEIPSQKTINVKRPNADYLIEIRKGKHDLKTLLTKCENDIKSLDDVFIYSDLPDKISTENKEMIHNLINKIKREYYENNI